MWDLSPYVTVLLDIGSFYTREQAEDIVAGRVQRNDSSSKISRGKQDEIEKTLLVIKTAFDELLKARHAILVAVDENDEYLKHLGLEISIFLPYPQVVGGSGSTARDVFALSTNYTWDASEVGMDQAYSQSEIENRIEDEVFSGDPKSIVVVTNSAERANIARDNGFGVAILDSDGSIGSAADEVAQFAIDYFNADEDTKPQPLADAKPEDVLRRPMARPA